jgi:MFS family permease
MIIEQGMTRQAAASIASVYAAGTIVGRVLCGLALDRYSTRIVTAVSMGIPALGFLMLAGGPDTLGVVTAAMFIVGVSVGAESDLLCYLVARYFKLRIYSTTLGLVHCVAFIASASGGVAASWSLHAYDSFTPLLYLIAGTIAVGSALFLFLPRERGFEKIG